ncbi:MAG: hypothetical protein QOI78_1317 [Actinomycetota bacterium]|nr:hypothetical protein [Actinomycetota bacterium]
MLADVPARDHQHPVGQRQRPLPARASVSDLVPAPLGDQTYELAELGEGGNPLRPRRCDHLHHTNMINYRPPARHRVTRQPLAVPRPQSGTRPSRHRQQPPHIRCPQAGRQCAGRRPAGNQFPRANGETMSDPEHLLPEYDRPVPDRAGRDLDDAHRARAADRPEVLHRAAGRAAGISPKTLSSRLHRFAWSTRLAPASERRKVVLDTMAAWAEQDLRRQVILVRDDWASDDWSGRHRQRFRHGAGGSTPNAGPSCSPTLKNSCSPRVSWR